MANLFKQKAQAPVKKPKKDELPEFPLNPESSDDKILIDMAANWSDAKKKKTEAESDITKAESLLIDRATQEHLKGCQDNDKYYSSVKAVLPDGKKYVFSFANRYSKIDPSSEDELKTIYGQDYKNYFKECTEVVLTETAVNDEKFSEELAKLVGEDKFNKYFSSKTFVLPTDNYHEHRMVNPELAQKHAEAVDAGLVKCNKPSIKEG